MLNHYVQQTTNLHDHSSFFDIVSLFYIHGSSFVCNICFNQDYPLCMAFLFISCSFMIRRLSQFLALLWISFFHQISLPVCFLITTTRVIPPVITVNRKNVPQPIRCHNRSRMVEQFSYSILFRFGIFSPKPTEPVRCLALIRSPKNI